MVKVNSTSPRPTLKLDGVPVDIDESRKQVMDIVHLTVNNQLKWVRNRSKRSPLACDRTRAIYTTSLSDQKLILTTPIGAGKDAITLTKMAGADLFIYADTSALDVLAELVKSAAARS